jgi:hypothetical protein
MSDKSLAYVTSIKSKISIEGKDRIMLFSMNENDWTVISAKDDFNPGDRAIYFEVNSILPETPVFEFLRKRCWSEKRQGFVLKTMKMGGVLSQGLLLRLDMFPGVKADIGDNLTETLGIRAIEDEAPKIDRAPKSKFELFIDKWFYLIFGRHFLKKTSGNFPSGLISKTDETQAQNLGYVYDVWKGKNCYSTVKCDGSSLTVLLNKGRFIVASRNQTLFEAKLSVAAKKLNPERENEYNGNVWLKAVCKYDLPKKLKNQKSFALQAEVVGIGIQKNRMGLKGIDMLVFNVYDIESKRYLSWDGIKTTCDKLGLKTVSFIEKFVFSFADVKELREYAKGNYDNGHPREGVVIRLLGDDGYVPGPERGMSNQASFKIINEDFRAKTE